jgi:hypothetical protein
LGSWNVGVNWSATFAPDASFDETAVIDNHTTVILDAHTTSNDISVNVGGLKVGTTAGSGGALRIHNNGILPNVPGSTATGAIAVGVAGQGNLIVLGGGTISGTSLSLGGSSGSSIQLGDASGLTATLSVDGPADLARTTTVVGPDVDFDALGDLTLGSANTLIGEIRHPTIHSPLKSQGTAAVDGTFKPVFVSVTPMRDDRWTLIDAVQIEGTFANLDLSMAPALPPGDGYASVQTTSGGREQLQLVVLPEPSCVAPLALAAIPLLRSRRCRW